MPLRHPAFTPNAGISAWRGVIAATVALAFCAVGGCICLGMAPARPFNAETGIDMQRIDVCGQYVLDLTAYGEGQLTEADLRARFENDDMRLELRELPDVAITYMLLVERVGGRRMIVLPGSTNQTNIETVLQLAFIPDDELNVALHDGFRATALAVREDVKPLLDRDSPVGISGYSLGGAAGAILAAYLYREGYDIDELVTFGAPKFTDVDGAGRMTNLPLKRVVAGDDPIAYLPIGEYAQVGDELILLDGPVVAYVPFGSDEYGIVTGLAVTLNDATFHDHLSYAMRLLSKRAADLVQVTFGDRGCYLNP